MLRIFRVNRIDEGIGIELWNWKNEWYASWLFPPHKDGAPVR
jgi:hypothetical protein